VYEDIGEQPNSNEDIDMMGDMNQITGHNTYIY